MPVHIVGTSTCNRRYMNSAFRVSQLLLFSHFLHHAGYFLLRKCSRFLPGLDLALTSRNKFNSEVPVVLAASFVRRNLNGASNVPSTHAALRQAWVPHHNKEQDENQALSC